jgi:hypothetical protein
MQFLPRWEGVFSRKVNFQPGILCVLLGFVLHTGNDLIFAEENAGGTPWTGLPGVQETTAEIMSRQASTGKIQLEDDGGKKRPKKKADRSNLTQNPDSPAMASFPAAATPGSGAGGPNAAQTGTISFTGATLADTRAFPPDSMGAAGPSQFIVAVNGRIRTFNKSAGLADGVLDTDTGVFFNSVMTPPVSNNFTSDPRIRYDRLSGRWVIIMIDVPGQAGNLPNRVMLAVSDSGVITGSTVWTYFFFQQDQVSPTGDTGNFADYPTLGVDANALYIGVNIFGGRHGSFVNTTGFVVRKSSILGAGPIVVTAFRKLIGRSGGPYTPQGVDNYDPAATEGYFIGADSSVFGRLDLRRVSNPGGTPTISGNISITVPTTSEPLAVPHLGNTGGTTGDVDGLDDRLLSAHIRNGRLWTSHQVSVDNTGVASGSGTRNGERWYELQGIATGQTPGVAQSGTIFQSSAGNTTDQRFYWMGTVMVSGQGHAAVGFSTAGVNEFINAGIAGRLAGDPLGTMQASSLYTSSSSSYNPPSDTVTSGNRRWGDYSYTSLDPSDDMTMWTIQEYCNAQDTYAVRVLKLMAPPPATPVSCNPPSVPPGASNVNVVVTGASASGSGFFDPGAGFSHRIAATVGGAGVTVKGIAYADPTHITLNIDVSPAAAASARTIAVTNPDGQAVVSSSGILTVATVVVSNQAPVLAAIANHEIAVGMTLILTNAASDSDGDQLTFSLGAGAAANATIDPTNGVLTWAPTQGQLGTNAFSVIVTDNGSPALSATQSFTVLVMPSNSPPVLDAISNQTVMAGTILTITNIATDSDGDQLTFSLGTGAAAGADINPATGVFMWTPSQAQSGTNNFSVVVTDNGFPALTATQTFAVIVTPTNSPPVLAAITNQTIAVGMALVITNIASDSDGDQLAFSLGSGAAANAAINPTNGVFTWTPTPAQTGSNAFSVIVTDNGIPLLSATRSFTVVVMPSNSPPVLAAISNQTIAVGMALIMTNVASDSDGDQLTFTLGVGAATNAGINPTNGVLTWSPTQAQIGSNAFSVVVTDNGFPASSATQSFTVTVMPSNSPPVLVAISNQTIAIGMTLIITNVASDSDGDQLTFSLGAGAAGNAGIDPATGVFMWSPTQAQIGSNAFSVVVTDNGFPSLSASQSFTVTVMPSNSPPVLAAISNQAIIVGVTLTITNAATDPDGNQLTFSLDPGAPTGAAIDPASGIFSWTPADSFAGTTNNLTVRVTDNGLPPLSDSQNFSVTVLLRPLVITAVTVSTNGVNLSWSAVAGKVYRVQSATDLNGSWTDLTGDVTASGAVATKLDASVLADQQYYRVLQAQ